MSTRKFSLACAALALAALACTSETSPTAPQLPSAAPAAPQASLLGDLTGTVNTLLFCPTSQSYTATQAVGPGGGVISVGPHSLSIPAGALDSVVTITATAPAGNYVDVEFQPHGLVFNDSATLRLSYAQCGLTGLLMTRIAYVDDSFNILEIIPSFGDIWHQQTVGRIGHFSSYAIAY